jgi:hypothetical protein
MCEGDTLLRVTKRTLANRARSTQTKVEGIMLKAAFHWGSDSKVVNNPLKELCHNPLYVGLLYVWGSMDGKHMFSLHFMGQLLN